MPLPTPFNLQPTLIGKIITLHPLQEADFEGLYAAAADPLIWQQHPQPTRYLPEVFQGFLASAVASGGALTVRDAQTGAVIGATRYYEWDASTCEVAIGYTFLARSHWGRGANPEMKQLMLAHAFQWARTVWFHIGKTNIRSRKAIEAIGARYSHQGSLGFNGAVADYVFYKIEAGAAFAG